jgi:N-acetylmuramoyl-L-alanine amidase
LALLLIANCSLLIAQSRLDVIVLDAGHGGKDPGTIGDFTGIQEKNIVLPITMKLGKLIEDSYPAIRIIYPRSTDEFIEVKERTRIANQNFAKLFISIHANHKKVEESQKKGLEIYLLNKERFPEAVQITMNENIRLAFSQLGSDTVDNFIYSSLVQDGYTRFNEYLASIIEVNMLNYTELESRGIIQAGNWVSLGASMPSVLVETGYLSDEGDELYLSSDRGQNDVANALFNAFQQYKHLFETQ